MRRLLWPTRDELVEKRLALDDMDGVVGPDGLTHAQAVVLLCVMIALAFTMLCAWLYSSGAPFWAYFIGPAVVFLLIKYRNSTALLRLDYYNQRLNYAIRLVIVWAMFIFIVALVAFSSVRDLKFLITKLIKWVY